jgi:serine protease Do
LSEANLPVDLSGIAAKVLPSVVSINVQVAGTSLFGQPATQESAGSGWVVDSNGLIVTNNHVVQEAQNISVSLSDGRNFPARQVAADPVTDLAVIQIDAAGLQAATVGDSSKLKPGMMVMAIGNALGEGLTVTAGWVSRLGVSLTVQASGNIATATLFDLIEVSTPVNPGNSGGPLFNMLGEVVGITNAKLVTTGVENVGFAISTKSAISVIQQLVQSGKVTRPYMGISIQDVDAATASIYNLAVTQGALISEVDPGGPAAQVGLKAGDVIVNMDGITITSAADAVQAILTSKIGQQVSVTFYRSSTPSIVEVTLAQNPNP